MFTEGRKVYSKGTVKVEKASDLPKEESWILEKCDVTVKREDITASDTKGNLNNLHAKDSSDDDNDDDLESSDINEPVMKKIKLVGT
jgi:hypothetical protein